ncbi:hypothetical protein G9U51_11850 [Calidifontibacter sp. DB0510]|uniref:Uncharacterized protein n=1 Tax=Metallococcus carri TaxID=1656884 RepID=A0A967B813_9MICO|nr:PPA1309 family protein [Metallococcus carri]NHN56471.1 hypothetical protein [Metallococcus carri]NOP36095.1 hypothetical protein [Calidifontibacter sp. DB2511S]
MDASDGPTAKPVLSALGQCAVDTERHVARAGWDQAPRLFAIARNGDLAAREPALQEQLAGLDPQAYSTVEQEGFPSTSSIESLLGRLAWPPEVDGVALAIERIVVPPAAERDLPEDPEQAAETLAAHEDRQDVRLFVAVLRDGERICLLRQRAHDEDDKVALGTDIAPGLVAALEATLAD